MEIVPSTREHIEKLVPVMSCATVRALSAVVDGDVVAIGGVYRTGNDHAAFMHITDEMKKRPKLLLSVTKKFLSTTQGRILATCDPSIENAENFLIHLGFRKIGGRKWLLYR